MTFVDHFVFGTDPEPAWFQDMITRGEAHIKTIGMHLACEIKTKSQEFRIKMGDTLNLTDKGTLTVTPMEAI